MVLWVHETTTTTKSEAAACLMKSMATGFNEDRVSELFNLLERTVEHKVTANITDLVNLKYEKRNH